MTEAPNHLKAVRLYIDTQKEHVVYMLHNCPICKSEGFEALTRLKVTAGDHSLIASLHIINKGILQIDEAGLSESAWLGLQITRDTELTFSHIQPMESMRWVRAKMYRKTLTKPEFKSILTDIVMGHYSNIEIAAFITACAGDNLEIEEIVALTQAMVEAGQRLHWGEAIVVDKHCVGGLPGNRTTPIVVAIVAAAGLTIPKNSSRAITSPAGTADTMETMTHVNLSMEQIKQVVDQENGCFVWDGSARMSPADDILIRVERALDVDSEGQMIASVLSKKVAAGSTHVVIDIPVGPTAKVRTEAEAEKLKYYFKVVGNAMGLKMDIILTDGSQPVGRGIGPALEAIDVLKVLRNDMTAPEDLRERSVLIAGRILDLANNTKKGTGLTLARKLLINGEAYAKFMAICMAQGGFKEPLLAPYHVHISASRSGTVVMIDNRKLARIAKLAGAPQDHSAGVLLHTPINSKVSKGDNLFTVYAEVQGELSYAMDYLTEQDNVITIQ